LSLVRRFCQVDVFAEVPYAGNPVAVVLDAEGLSTEQMQRFAAWTNLSETAFVVPPTMATADYALRMFTPSTELPFAGHPTLGTCHAWISATGTIKDRVVQECKAGAIPIRRSGEVLAFAAPPLVRSGPVEEPLLAEIAAGLRIDRTEIVDAQWVDNGPGWVAVLLADADAVRALWPGNLGSLYVGAIGPHPPGCYAPAVPRRRTSRAKAVRWGGTGGCTSRLMTTARSGSAAARSPVSPARCRSRGCCR